MKLRTTTTTTLAIALSGFAGTALAANAVAAQPITDSAVVSECLQGTQAPGAVCGRFDAVLSKDFTPREIRMVSEWDATEPDFLFDKIESLHRRFDRVLQHYVEQQDATRSQVAKG